MKKEPFTKSDAFRSIMASLLSIIIGLVVGSIVILIVGLCSKGMGASSAFEGIRLVFGGLFSTGRNEAGALTFGFNPANFGNMLFRAMPLIMTGLSVGMAYKTGLFNIGAPGQYLMGTLVSLWISLSIPHESVPSFLIWLLAFLGGMIAGALWGAIPGLLKAFLNINEVIACIMTNWIAATFVTWMFGLSSLQSDEPSKSGYIFKTAHNEVVTAKMGLDRIFKGSQINAGIIIAILLAIGVHIMMSKTTFGYQLKACGSNRNAARYAGINDKLNIVLSMAIAGALAAAGASLYYLSGNTEFAWTNAYQSLPAEGFNGIAVALLAVCNPIGIIFTALFMSMLSICGTQLTALTAYNEYITDVIISVIVYLSAFSLMIKMWLGEFQKKRAAKATVATTATPPQTNAASAKKGGNAK